MFDPDDPQQLRFMRALAAGDELAWAAWRETYLEAHQIALEVAKESVVAALQAVDNPKLFNRF